VKELNKTIQDLKMEIETIKKSQKESTLKIENLRKRPGVIDASITNRIQEIEERIPGTKDTIENIDTTVWENAKCKKLLTQEHPGNPGHNEKTKPKDTRYRRERRQARGKCKNISNRNQGYLSESSSATTMSPGYPNTPDSQLKGPVNIFNKIIEENLNLKKEMPMNIQEAYRAPNRLDQKRNSSCHIIVKTPNAWNKERILKAVREKGQVAYKGRPIRSTPDFSPETMKARRSWAGVIQNLREQSPGYYTQ
jgi:DNA-binding transcriptional MocR family regulator